MKRTNNGDTKDRPFTHIFILAILLIVIPTIGLISVHDYVEEQNRMTSDLSTLQNVTERSIRTSVENTDAGLKLFDDALNARLETGFDLFLREYNRTGGDPSAMDLAGIKERMGGMIDLYVINEEGVIEYTTYPPDQGRDFRDNPEFYAEITELRQGDSFAADRVVYEQATGQIRKFAYMPTPDHRYLLELGFVPEAFADERNRVRSMENMQNLVALNPYLESIQAYDVFGNPVDETNTTINPDAQRLVTEVIVPARSDYEVQGDGKLTRYLFIDLKDPAYPSDTSLIIELTYNTALIQDELDQMLFYRSAIALLAISLCSIAILAVTRRLTRPIAEIVDDIEVIADGDLDHTVRVAAAREVRVLEQSINRMVGTLKSTISRLKESEETIREYSEGLEEQVRERTVRLQESTEKANLYLDIMAHDVNNTTNTAILYADLLLEELDGEPREYTEKLHRALQKNAQIIRNVNTIRQIHEGKTVLAPVALDPVIRAEIEHYPDTRIRYAGTGAHVLADDLLSEIFTNLIGNAAKFGGPEVEVAIAAREHGGEVVVSVEDTGPGIPDAVKTELFSRFTRGGGEKSGRGLGLYICRMLVERYGGRIWVEDRVPGEPERGTAIRFTLQKADTG
ncbi:HAMP domain-containing histidine kinase [Methanoculleus sp. FWC-SCC1]|uniref:histidine kinase n=1 Tax=Methanoculleus frigidifontis TaxID=2584085 RepID=A0ABT8MD97_9EURY|nr:HAMP domain-containing sensor histidine kinase [Methanoculleus sp. FWC-SCC1]MDN7025901.1 HAMP domain-containing histidine kinase [Methanoculleus sp. FWC-SCC1]